MNISGEAPAAGLQLEEKPATHFFEVNQFSIVSVYTQTLFFRTNVQNDQHLPLTQTTFAAKSNL